MAIHNKERYELELAVFQLRGEAGLRKLHELMQNRMAVINSKWPDAVGDELLQLQGEARALQKQLKLLEHGPTIKPEAVK